MNNDWIEQETRYLSTERKKKNVNTDNYVMIQYLILLIPLFFYAMSLHAFNNVCEYEESSYNDGIFWTCKRCRTSQWSNQRDWTGHYYCANCGVKAGDE